MQERMWCTLAQFTDINIKAEIFGMKYAPKNLQALCTKGRQPWVRTGGQSKDICKIIYAGGLTVVLAQQDSW